MNKKYTHIFFDLDNTLWDFETNSRNAMQLTFNKLKLNENFDFNSFFKIYTVHNDLLWQSYRNNEVIKKDLTRLRFQNTFNDMGINGIEPENMNTLYLDEMPNQTNLNEGVTEMLGYLKQKGYHLSIITNGFKEVQLKKIETSGLKPFIDKVFISEEIKSPKPEKEIFEFAIKSSNARKSKSLMVGDDWEVDVLGALHYGIDAVYYLHSNTQNLTNVRYQHGNSGVIYEIEAIGQLKSIL